MILEARKRTPFVHFGFNETYKTAIANEVVDVYLKTVYNQDYFQDFNLVALGSASLIEVSNYHYQVTYSTQGVKNITLQIEKATPKELNSNILELEIIPLTFDTTKITFDNNNLTWDSN